MVGQERILNWISNTKITEIPHSVLITGPVGGGKHTIANNIGNKVGVPVEDATDILSFEFIDGTYQITTNKCFLINLDKITSAKQNILLKFVEEPLKNIYVILISSDVKNVIETIKNRCFCIVLDKYDKETLKTFIDASYTDEDVLLIEDICETPGQILSLNGMNVRSMKLFSDKVIDKIGVANLPNALSISDKVAFKDEKNKYDVNLFYTVLIKSAFKKVLDNDPCANRMFDCIRVHKYLNEKPGIDKRLNFENMIIEMWKLARNSDDNTRT